MHPLHPISFGVADLAQAGRFYDASYYAAFVIDTAGHAIEAVCKAPD